MGRIPLNKGGSIAARAGSRDILRRSREMQQRRRLRIWYFWGGLLLFLIAGILIFLNQRMVLVSGVLVSGNEITHTSEIVATTEGLMTGTYALVIPKKSIFFYPRVLIEQTLLSRYPRLETVEIERKNFQTLSIEVTERHSEALWCIEADTASTTEAVPRACYFLDPSGLVIARAPQFSPGVFLEISGEPLAEPLGKRPISEGELGQLIELSQVLPTALRQMPGVNFYLAQVTLDSDSYNLAIRSRRSGTAAWTLLLSRSEPLGGALSNLQSILGSEEFKKDYQVPGARLEYIDIRYGKKVFYKFVKS